MGITPSVPPKASNIKEYGLAPFMNHSFLTGVHARHHIDDWLEREARYRTTSLRLRDARHLTSAIPPAMGLVAGVAAWRYCYGLRGGAGFAIVIEGAELASALFSASINGAFAAWAGNYPMNATRRYLTNKALAYEVAARGASAESLRWEAVHREWQVEKPNETRSEALERAKKAYSVAAKEEASVPRESV
jgi:hypothetical protein